MERIEEYPNSVRDFTNENKGAQNGSFGTHLRQSRKPADTVGEPINRDFCVHSDTIPAGAFWPSERLQYRGIDIRQQYPVVIRMGTRELADE